MRICIKCNMPEIRRKEYEVKTTIVCGILGSGKTTFIRNVLKDSLEKVVVLVNDFGKTGIDGEVLSVGGVEAVELPSGCVCCTLKFDLIRTIGEVMEEFRPDHLYIEPSGVASPSGVLEALGSLKVNPVTVVGIVDSSEFVELYESGMYGKFFEDQIINSDIILINKTDTVEEEKVMETIELVKGMNVRAIIIPTVRAALSEPLPEVARDNRTISSHTGHVIHCETVSLKLKDNVSFNTVRELFRDMQWGSFGKVFRAKALVQTDKGPFRFDLSSGRVETEPFGKPVTDSRLVVIGESLKAPSISTAVAAPTGPLNP